MRQQTASWFGLAGCALHAIGSPVQADHELSTTRLIPFRRELIFRAIGEPEYLAQWWGPAGFRSTIHEFEFRPGARWRLTLHGPDGTDYENEYFLLHVAEPHRVVISHPDPMHVFELSITLTEEGNSTRLEWQQRFESAQHSQEVKSFVETANEQVLDRLEAVLATLAGV